MRKIVCGGRFKRAPKSSDVIGILSFVKNRRKTLLTDDSEFDRAITVKPMKDGPFVINGSFYLERENGVKSKFNGTVSICRCGKTRLQPFCDGSHRMG